MCILQGHSGLVHGLYTVGTSPHPCATTPFHTRLQTKTGMSNPLEISFLFAHTLHFVTFTGVWVDPLTRRRPVVGKREGEKQL